MLRDVEGLSGPKRRQRSSDLRADGEDATAPGALIALRNTITRYFERIALTDGVAGVTAGMPL